MTETGFELGAPPLIGEPASESILGRRVTGCLLVARAGLEPAPTFDEPQESVAGEVRSLDEALERF
jgi:hypothetical protein